MSHVTGSDFIHKIVNRYSDMLIRIAFQYTFSREDSEDIMQDVLLSFIQQPSFNDEEHIKAWLIRAAINKAKDLMKSARKKRTVPLKERQYELFYGMSEQDTEVLDAVKALPELDRTVIYLHYFEGYKASEIAAVIGKREAAVFARLTRARAKLKDLIEEIRRPL